jgi:hypothetical protein
MENKPLSYSATLNRRHGDNRIILDAGVDIARLTPSR